MLQKLSLTVTGMKCGGCEATVKSKLLSLEGVTAAQVNHKENKAELDFDKDKITAAQITEVITRAGYQVQL